MKKYLLIVSGLLAVLAVFLIPAVEDSKFETLATNDAWEKEKAKKRFQRQNGYVKLDEPDKLQEFHRGIRTREGENAPAYQPNYRFKELNKLKSRNRASRRTSNTPGVLEYIERGPSNVPGRTRALVVLPGDPSHNTWLAGASGGGIWKTTNAGASWENKSADFPTLAVSTLAMSDSDPNIIYAGTGEYIASAGTAIEGDGIFKSTDGGDTWVHLTATSGSKNFISVTRVIVDPSNPDVVLSCSAPNRWDNDFNSVIMKSVDGGATWYNVFTVETGGAVEQLIADPDNFNIIYAAQNGVGVLKSIDAGETWEISSSGMSPDGRIEIAVSPVNPNKVYASTQGSLSGNASDLYVSSDKGVSWDLVGVKFNASSVDFLGGQGWYDNTIVCHPYNEDIVYYGGVGLFRTEITNGSNSSQYVEFAEIPPFMAFVNFGADAEGGALEIGPSANGASVILKFGNGASQMAHRFTVPANGGSNNDGGAGIPASDYSYNDYVAVPFEVYEVDENGTEIRQLMVSFRDQQRDGGFNLNPRDDVNDPNLLTAREYVYINNVDYDATTPDANITTNGGHEYNEMYFFWPILVNGQTWDPDNLPESSLKILTQTVETLNASTLPIADPYGDYNGLNSFDVWGEDVHPDQHFTVAIKENEASETFRIVLTNDGGVFVTDESSDPGAVNGSWNFSGKTYNTSQFYGADKMPGGESYIGGMQDNGTWYSPTNTNANDKTAYIFAIGGDGFEVLWHSQDPDKMIGGSQNNGLARTTDGGATWNSASAGLSGSHPFITKLAGSKSTPDVIYCVSSAGVFKSNNFGGSWNLTPITSNWVGTTTFLDVEVSRANPDIVWAGSGMGVSTKLHVSTDEGVTFSETNNYTGTTLGAISRLASHPSEPNTAYALFSFAEGPKVLRTTDLGQTWEDISGFDNNSTSANGFPDVAVYCLYVRPDNPDIIWVGTEIGIVESTDNGATWSFNEDYISASVWDMKGQDNEIVMATHGRGIWSAVLEVSQNGLAAPQVTNVYNTPDEKVIVELEFQLDYDEYELYADGNLVFSGANATIGSEMITLTDLMPGDVSFSTRATVNGAKAASTVKIFPVFDLDEPANSLNTAFGNPPAFYGDDFAITSFAGNPALQTIHNYNNDMDAYSLLGTPITVSSSLPMLYYSDVAIVEPDRDIVSVEATKDGINWVKLKSYDASENANWTAAFNAGADGDRSMMVDQEIDLSNFFEAGDLILIRFRIQSDEQNVGWGWAIDNLSIQQAPTAVKRPATIDFTIAPNPVSNGQLRISATENIQMIELIDLSGKRTLVNNYDYLNNTAIVNTQGINSGIYTLRVYTKSGFDTEKIVISN